MIRGRPWNLTVEGWAAQDYIFFHFAVFFFLQKLSLFVFSFPIFLAVLAKKKWLSQPQPASSG
jgi:hypothetical protein